MGLEQPVEEEKEADPYEGVNNTYSNMSNSDESESDYHERCKTDISF